MRDGRGINFQIEKIHESFKGKSVSKDTNDVEAKRSGLTQIQAAGIYSETAEMNPIHMILTGYI